MITLIAPVLDSPLLRVKTASFNLAQAAGNYTLFTATGGEILLVVKWSPITSGAVLT